MSGRCVENVFIPQVRTNLSSLPFLQFLSSLNKFSRPHQPTQNYRLQRPTPLLNLHDAAGYNPRHPHLPLPALPPGFDVPRPQRCRRSRDRETPGRSSGAVGHSVCRSFESGAAPIPKHPRYLNPESRPPNPKPRPSDRNLKSPTDPTPRSPSSSRRHPGLGPRYPGPRTRSPRGRQSPTSPKSSPE